MVGCVAGNNDCKNLCVGCRKVSGVSKEQTKVEILGSKEGGKTNVQEFWWNRSWARLEGRMVGAYTGSMGAKKEGGPLSITV